MVSTTSQTRVATSSKPSQKWLKQAAALLEPVGHENFARIAAGVLAQVGKPARTPPRRTSGIGDQTDPTLIHDVADETALYVLMPMRV